MPTIARIAYRIRRLGRPGRAAAQQGPAQVCARLRSCRPPVFR
ncbi:hypothetical protein [Lysobacter gummosus]